MGIPLVSLAFRTNVPALGCSGEDVKSHTKTHRQVRAHQTRKGTNEKGLLECVAPLPKDSVLRKAHMLLRIMVLAGGWQASRLQDCAPLVKRKRSSDVPLETRCLHYNDAREANLHPTPAMGQNWKKNLSGSCIL